MARAVESLKEQREVLQAAIARHETFIKNNVSNRISPTSFSELKTSMDNLLEAFNVYCEIQDSTDNEDCGGKSTENEYSHVFAKFVRPVHGNEVTETISTNSIQSSDYETCVQKPSNIFSFSGNYEDWKSFYEMFSLLIDSNTDLLDVQKFAYLKNWLSDEALALIDDLKVSDENYTIALDILKKRYNNKASIINFHVKSIFEVQKLSKTDPFTLRKFITTIEKHYNALKSLDVAVEYWDIILLHVLTDKLDHDTHLLFKTVSNDLPSYNDFVNYLETRCKELECTSNLNRNEYHVKNYLPSIKSRNNFLYCNFCGKRSHKIFKCFKFSRLSVSIKRAFIEKNKICYNCLSANHTVDNCLSSSTCRVCSQKHNTLLHDKDSQSGNNAYKVEEGTSGLSDPTCIDSTFIQILLSTCNVMVQAENGNQIQVKAVLGSGSQGSFITTEAFRKLTTDCKSNPLRFKGINGQIISVHQTVELSVISRVNPNQSKKTAFGILDEICVDLPEVPVEIDHLEIPKNIELADDSFYIPSKIDMLIGADLFSDIIIPGIIELGSNLPVLKNTLFGWVVAGPAPHSELVSLNSTVSLVAIKNDIDD